MGQPRCRNHRNTASKPQYSGHVNDLDRTATSYYRQLDHGGFTPTGHVQGAWVAHEQHMAPVGGLIIHALEHHEPREDLQLSKITFEILGQIPLGETTVDVEVVRPGRTIELMAATLSVEGRPVVRATAWRLMRVDTTAVEGGYPAPLPDPETVPVWDGAKLWGGGYISSLEIRLMPESRPGHGRAWIKTPYNLVAGHPSSPTAEFCKLIDTANGIATRVNPREWMFPNTDLSIHLFRNPAGPWVGFDTTVVFGPSGTGLTSSTLFDVNGAVGRAEQILTVRPMPVGVSG